MPEMLPGFGRVQQPAAGAKAIAGLWKVPLLRLDMAALYNKFHGETERNLRDTLQLADNVSPCVLWTDEIEKSLGQSDNEGISQRVLGTLLTWMAERKSPAIGAFSLFDSRRKLSHRAFLPVARLSFWVAVSEISL